MTRKSFFQRNLKGVAIAICLAGVTMFSGCGDKDKDDNSLSTNTGNLKYDTKTYTLDKAKIYRGEDYASVVFYELASYGGMSGWTNYI